MAGWSAILRARALQPETGYRLDRDFAQARADDRVLMPADALSALPVEEKTITSQERPAT
jgi:hypothetical protein